MNSVNDPDFPVLSVFKVTVYLQEWLASGVSWRYLNPSIKLNLIELAIKHTKNFEIK